MLSKKKLVLQMQSKILVFFSKNSNRITSLTKTVSMYEEMTRSISEIIPEIKYCDKLYLNSTTKKTLQLLSNITIHLVLVPTYLPISCLVRKKLSLYPLNVSL